VDFSRQFIYDNEDIVRDLKHDIESRLRSYWDALTWFFGELFKARLPNDWREQWHAVVAEQARRGYITDPQSVRDVEEYIAAWAKYCELEPKEEPEAATYTITIEHHDENVETAQNLKPQVNPLSPAWPRLTQSQRDQAQALTGLPWWFPLRPENRMDGMWELRLERLARTARDELLDCYREIAGLGRLAKSIHGGSEPDLAPMEAQLQRVQQAYDKYLRARIAIELEWASYLRTESLVGTEVQALMEKIDAALPTRIDQFKSPLDSAMAAAAKAVKQATDAALARAERQYTIAVWTDRAITAIQLVAAGVTVGRAAVKIFAEVAEHAGKKEAVKAATKYVATQLATATVSVGVAVVVVPEVLSAAGLDPVEIQIGMAAYGAVGLLSTVVAHSPARGASRISTKHEKLFPDSPPKNPGPHFIEGTLDSPRTAEHQFLQWTVAEDMAESGLYSRVGMRVSLSKFSGHKHSPDIQPDDIGLTHEGQIDMIEILSPGQTKLELVRKLTKAMKQLPEHMRGQWIVTNPNDVKGKLRK
jgi:hypothetical protein